MECPTRRRAGVRVTGSASGLERAMGKGKEWSHRGGRADMQNFVSHNKNLAINWSETQSQREGVLYRDVT